MINKNTKKPNHEKKSNVNLRNIHEIVIIQRTNLYCVRLVIVSLAMNIGKLQSLVSEHNFFCSVYNDFCRIFLETFGSLKIRNFGYTLSYLQLLRK